MFQLIVTLSLSIKLQKHEKRPQNLIAMHAGKGPYSSCAGKHGGRYQEYVFKPKTSSRFSNFEATMGDKSVETLGSKIRFLSVFITFSPLPPKNNVDFSISSTAQTTAPTQHSTGGPGG